MLKSMSIPNKAGIHIIEHYCGNYWGSCSFLIDLAVNLANPERIIIFSHKDINPVEFVERSKKQFLKMGKNPEDIGRLLCVSGGNIEEQLFHQEMGLYPGMEMVVLVGGNELSGVLKYLYNSDPEIIKFISVVVGVQCGFKKSFINILKRERTIESCLMNGYLDTYVYEENQKPHTIDGKTVQFDIGSVGYGICSIGYSEMSSYRTSIKRMVDTLSL